MSEDVPEWPAWSAYVQQAWRALRDDRFYGAMGGLGSIYYAAKSKYASDHNIPLEPFLTFLGAMDDEYMAWTIEKAKTPDPPPPE